MKGKMKWLDTLVVAWRLAVAVALAILAAHTDPGAQACAALLRAVAGL